MKYAYLGNNVGLVLTSNDYRMYVDTLDTCVAPHLILDGHWEGWITDFIRSTLAPESVFVDIGAQLGWYTLLALECRASRIFSFEPNPLTHGLLERTLTLNGIARGRVTLFMQALLDREEKLQFYFPKRWSGNARLLLDTPFAHEQRTDTEEECFSVTTRSLDSLKLGQVDYVKIDAEGAESRILRGAEETIDDNPQIRLLVEHHALEAEYETITWLQERFGFRLAYVDHTSRLRQLKVTDLPSLPDSEMLFLARS